MAIFHGNAIPSGEAGDYSIDYSCRFDSASSAKLSRTPGSAGNRRTYTISFWFKRGVTAGATMYLFDVDGNGEIYILSSDLLGSQGYGGGYQQYKRVFRDFSGWYHYILAVDTTQGSAGDRVKQYLNGELLAAADYTGTLPNENDDSDVNNDDPHTIGGKTSGNYFDGLIAEFHLIDGTQLDQTSFGESGDYGEWKAKRYSGSHGTNGFHLDFSNASALGDDAAGSNDFSVTNITASDQMTDTPTNNFCTWNPLDNFWFGSTFSEGNLQIVTGTGSEPTITGTFGMTSGKWYFEIQQTADASGANPGSLYGIAGQRGYGLTHAVGRFVDQYAFYGHANGGNIVSNSAYQSYGTIVGWTTGDIISIAVDLDNNKLYGAKNNVWFNSGDPVAGSNGYAILAASATSLGAYFPAMGDFGSYTITSIANFGQDGTFAGTKAAQGNADDEGYGNFYYDVPAGFKALCSKNLEDCAIKPKEHFNAVTYTGTGSSGPRTGVGFQPDLNWLKIRTGEAKSHMLTDSVRGVGKYLQTDGDSQELTDAQTVTSFDADGWSFGASGSSNQYNYSGRTYVAWNWKAGTAGSGSTSGSGTAKTYTSSYNTDAGFSITKYGGNGTAGHTIPHSLSVAPNLVITKHLDSAGWTRGWAVGSIQSLASMDFTDYLILNTTAAIASSASGVWNNVAPTASVFTCGDAGSFNYTNQNAQDYIAYCWHSVEGYSKIGCYVGNGNNDGPFIYTGFSPAYIMLKRIDASGKNWHILDKARDPMNDGNQRNLKANLTEVEDGGSLIDFLSNGFTTYTQNSEYNTSGGKYLYLAFAEVPFKNSNAV